MSRHELRTRRGTAVVFVGSAETAEALGLEHNVDVVSERPGGTRTLVVEMGAGREPARARRQEAAGRRPRRQK